MPEHELRQRRRQAAASTTAASVLVISRKTDSAARQRVAARLVLVGEVEAQERLDDPEADDDADEDHPVGEQLDDAVPAPRQMYRV